LRGIYLIKSPLTPLFQRGELYSYFDFVLSKHRDGAARHAVLENINILLMLAGLISFVEIIKVNYLNNLIEPSLRR